MSRLKSGKGMCSFHGSLVDWQLSTFPCFLLAYPVVVIASFGLDNGLEEHRRPSLSIIACAQARYPSSFP